MSAPVSVSCGESASAVVKKALPASAVAALRIAGSEPLPQAGRQAASPAETRVGAQPGAVAE